MGGVAVGVAVGGVAVGVGVGVAVGGGVSSSGCSEQRATHSSTQIAYAADGQVPMQPARSPVGHSGLGLGSSSVGGVAVGGVAVGVAVGGVAVGVGVGVAVGGGVSSSGCSEQRATHSSTQIAYAADGQVPMQPARSPVGHSGLGLGASSSSSSSGCSGDPPVPTTLMSLHCVYTSFALRYASHLRVENEASPLFVFEQMFR